MKKLVFASAMAIASLSLVWAPPISAQASKNSQINLPAPEFNAYQTATTESNPKAKAAALEGFLKTYPKSPVKKEVLDQLLDTYRQLGDLDKELSACSRLLKVDPNDLKAILYSVLIRKTECSKTINGSGVSSNPQPCNEAATMAKKGLAVSKPADVSASQWKAMTGIAYPDFHSAIAYDALVAKKDYNTAVSEYKAALMLYPPSETSKPGPALLDTLQLAQAYTKTGEHDIPNAVWFYARFWNFAPPAYKKQINTQLEYWYKRYHGGLDGLSAIKQEAAKTVFPPSSFSIKPALTPVQIAHKVVQETPDLTKLNLEDKEFILANGSPADAQKLWSVLQGQVTPVPGVVIGTTSSAVDVLVHVGPRYVRKFTVNLNSPMPTKQIRAVPDNVQQVESFLTTNGAPADMAKLQAYLKVEAHRITKIDLEPNASAIQMAVTQEAKNNKRADFIVNLKKPLEAKKVPQPGFEYSLLPKPELDATYSTYKPVPGKNGHPAWAQIVLSDGFVQVEPPKRPARRPAPRGHAR